MTAALMWIALSAVSPEVAAKPETEPPAIVAGWMAEFSYQALRGNGASITAGYDFGHLALLLTVDGFESTQLGQQVQSDGVTQVPYSTSVIGVDVEPALRAYLLPLASDHLSPFLQAGLRLGVQESSVTGYPTATAPTFGLDVGAGAEYLFNRHLGLLLRADLFAARTNNLNDGELDGPFSTVLTSNIWGGVEASAALTVHL